MATAGLELIYADRMTLSKIPQEEAFLKVFDPALFSFFFFFNFSFHSQKLTPLIHNNFGTKPLFLDTKCCWCFFQHWNCCNGSHAVPAVLSLTLATKSCFTQNFKTLQEVPI